MEVDPNEIGSTKEEGELIRKLFDGAEDDPLAIFVWHGNLARSSISVCMYVLS